MLDIVQIMEILPHRYPFLLVDKVIEIDPGKRIVAIKNVTMNEPFFQGHFPGFPVMPGVLIIEAMAQVAAIMAYLASGNDAGDKPVKPGDTLRIEIETIFNKRGIWSVAGKTYVGDTLMTEAELKATLADK